MADIDKTLPNVKTSIEVDPQEEIEIEQKKAEEAAEDAVINSIKAGLEVYATEQLMDNGRRSWPTNPWDALDTKPAGYTTDVTDADVDGEWTYNTTSKKITHQRGDNSRVGWLYDKGTQTGDNAVVGTLGVRASL